MYVTDETERVLWIWGRWASVRLAPSNGTCYSAEGRYRPEAGEVWGENIEPRLPPLSAADRQDAELVEAVIVRMIRKERGALAVHYAGVSLRHARRVHGLNVASYERVLPHARWNFQQEYRKALTCMEKFEQNARQIAAIVHSIGTPMGVLARPKKAPEPEMAGAFGFARVA